MKSRLIRMTEGKPGKLILQFALPLMLGSIFQQTYTIVDTAVVGQVVGVDGLAALGAADWFNWLSLGICTGLAQGFSILIAQFFGAKDEFRLKKAVAMSFLLTLAAAVILTAIFQIAAGPVLHLMGTDPSIMEGSMTYVRICFSGICVVLSYNVLAAILRAIGDSTTPLVAMVIAAAINVGLDLLFVAGFGGGIAGAASATVIGQFFSAVYCLIRLSRMEVMRLKRVHWKPDKTILTRLLTLSGPLAFQSTVIAVGGMILQSIVNTFGVIFVAGFTATNKLYGLLELAAISFGHAVATYTGQNLGARNYQRIKMGVRAGAKMAVLTALVTSAVMIVFGRFFISLFVDALFIYHVRLLVHPVSALHLPLRPPGHGKYRYPHGIGDRGAGDAHRKRPASPPCHRGIRDLHGGGAGLGRRHSAAGDLLLSDRTEIPKRRGKPAPFGLTERPVCAILKNNTQEFRRMLWRQIVIQARCQSGMQARKCSIFFPRTRSSAHGGDFGSPSQRRKKNWD